MKRLILITGVAGLVLVSTGTVFANDTTVGATSVVPPAKKDSGRVIPVLPAKETAPHRVLPPPPAKPNLPIDAGRKQGVANIGGPTATSGHKNGILNGTEIKRHP